MTSGGELGANGGQPALWRRPAMLTAGAFVGFGLVYVVVNATSLIDERRLLGHPVEAWQPWTWEITSFLAWLLLLPPVLWLASRTLPFSRWAEAAAVHLLATVPMSLAHTATMVAMRKLAYVAAGDTYRLSGPLFDVLIYEYRKDVITYASVVVALFVIGRLVVPPSPPERLDRPQALIEVRDGSHIAWFKAEEIDWVGAAGNYVELHGAFGTKLTRRSLSEMEAELAPHGFVRVHRSRLVRRGSVARIETRQSGDFVLTLRSGSIVSGSRRYRECLGARAVSHSELAE